MKRNIYILLIMLTGLIISCKPEDFKPIGEPTSKVEQLYGSWIISKVNQTDVNAANKGFPMEVQQMDITNLFPTNPFTDLSITFNTGTNSFTVTKGNSFSNWPNSGNWEFDNPAYPSKLMLQTSTDTITLGISNLSNLNALTPKITFREVKQLQSGNKMIDVIYYDYTFTKQ